MQKIFFTTLLVFFCWCNISRASDFKLDATQLEQKFENAVEVSFLDVTPTTVNSEHLINKNLIALSSVFCGTIGLHRYLLGHRESAKEHLIRTGASVLVFFAGIIVFYYGENSSNITGYGVMFAGAIIAVSGLLYGVAQEVFVIVEGVIYLLTPKERFNAKNGLRYDPRYFAAFKFHDVVETQ